MQMNQIMPTHKSATNVQSPKQADGFTQVQAAPSVGNLQMKAAFTQPSLPFSNAQVIQMQRQLGNRAVTEIMRSRLPYTSPIQRSVTSETIPASGSDPIVQLWKAETAPNVFTPIGGMNLLEVLEVKHRKSCEDIIFRAQNIGEYQNLTPDAAIDDAIKAGEDAGKEGIDPTLEGWVEQYIKLFGSIVSLKGALPKYQTIGAQNQALADEALAVQGVTNMAAFDARVTAIQTDLNDEVRDVLNGILQYGYSLDGFNYLPGKMNTMKTRIQDISMILFTTPGRKPHSPHHYLSTYAVKAPAYDPKDKRDVAIFEELVTLQNGVNAGIAFGPHFGPVVKEIVLANNFDNAPTSDAQFAEPNQVQRANLVNIAHTTKPGLGGYSGRSVWGKLSGGKLEVHALAEHGNTNKKYIKVSGNGNIPGNWRLK